MASAFTCKFSADSVQETDGGDVVLKQAVVARVGVNAKGHTIMLDKDGIMTTDAAKAKQTLPMHVDAQSITSALAAAKEKGRLRVRSDHKDELKDRAGYADNFAVSKDGNLVCDVYLFKSYADREIVTETAQKTPELIGLSMDFSFAVEVKDGLALVRIKEMNAVDIVDEGAVTPSGLFRSHSAGPGVDTQSQGRAAAQFSPTPNPPDMNEEQEKRLAALEAANKDLLARLSKFEASDKAAAGDEPAADDKKPAPDAKAEDKAGADEPDGDEADPKASAKALRALSAQVSNLTKTFAALGLKPAGKASEDVSAAQLSAKKVEAAASADPVAAFKQKIEEAMKTGLSRKDAVTFATKNSPEAYRAKLKAQGISK